MANSSEGPAPLTPHLSRKLLKIRAGWKVLDFCDRDWENIERLRSAPIDVARIYIQLGVNYIRENIGRVQRLSDVSRALTRVVTLGYDEEWVGILDRIDAIDTQSMFVLQINGAINIAKHDVLVDYLKSKTNSPWVVSRFSYPFVYHAINVPTDDYMETFLSFVIPHAAKNGTERDVVRHLLRDDISFETSLMFRCYVGLLCHPYDMLQSFISHFEIELSRDGALSKESADLLHELSSIASDPRLSSLMRIVDGPAPKYIDSADLHRDELEASSLPAQIHNLLIAFFDSQSCASAAGEPPTREWEILCRMRWSRYPEVEDFDYITQFTRTWRFSDGGRFMHALLTSMYMLPRRDEIFETREVQRMFYAANCLTSYVYGSPRGDRFLRSHALRATSSPDEIERSVSVALSVRAEAPDRTWFHAVHWKLRSARDEGQLKRWLRIARETFPVSPTFLTGVDWAWLERMIHAVRIAPFRATSDGPYALLLRDVEEHRRDSTVLRTAVEPQTTSRTCRQFVEWMIDEYGHWAAAFVKYLLTPENIMLLGLAPNMMAALSERIAALEYCAKAFDFTDLLTELQLRQEQQTLTSALMLLNVNASQFEIPWERFRRDVAERERDSFNGYSAMRRGDKTLSVITDHRTPYPHLFSNRQVVQYSILVSQTPLAIVIFGIIDLFIQHPSYGIEAILSTRFRHDTLRREFVSVLSALEASYMPGVVAQEQKRIIAAASSEVFDALGDWLQARVQTLRPGVDGALFDLTPSSDELNALLRRTIGLDALDEIVSVLIDWLGGRLEVQLDAARQSFRSEFLTEALSAVAKATAAVGADHDIDASVVARVTAAVNASVTRRTEELVDWFRAADPAAQQSLTLMEIKLAVEGRFERFVAADQLRITLSDCEDAMHQLPSDKVRFYFDLLSEIVQNAIKYGGVGKIRIRIYPIRAGKLWGFVYSSSASLNDPWSRTISGHKYMSLSDSLFREGNSGLDKIAALAASIVEADVEIAVIRRKRSFHLTIPIAMDA